MYIIYRNIWNKNLKALYNITNYVSHKNTIKNNHLIPMKKFIHIKKSYSNTNDNNANY